MRIKTFRPLHFRHNHKEFVTKGGAVTEDAPDWIAFDKYFGYAENAGVLRVLPSFKRPAPLPVAEAEPSIMAKEETSSAVTLESINALSWQSAFKAVATLEDKELLGAIAENGKFDSVKKAAHDRLISLGE